MRPGAAIRDVSFLLKLYADGGYQGPEFRRALKKGLTPANFKTVNRLAHLEVAVAAPKSARRGRIADAVPGGRRAISFGGAYSLDRYFKTFKPAVAIVKFHLPSLSPSPGGLDQIGQRP